MSEIPGKLKKAVKQLFSPRDGSAESRKVNPAVFLIIIAAALALVFLKPQGTNNNAGKADDISAKQGEGDYINKMEENLEDILSKISGAGNVNVRIYINTTNEKILAENKKSESEVSRDGNSERETGSSESQPMTGGGLSSSGEPYVVQEKLPYPSGILIVASGAGNERVRNEIYEAVRALYGLSANRIKITY